MKKLVLVFLPFFLTSCIPVPVSFEVIPVPVPFDVFITAPFGRVGPDHGYHGHRGYYYGGRGYYGHHRR